MNRLNDELLKYEKMVSDKQNDIRRLIADVKSLNKRLEDNDIKLRCATEQREQDNALIRQQKEEKIALERKLKDSLKQCEKISEEIGMVLTNIKQTQLKLRECADASRNEFNEKDREIKRLQAEVAEKDRMIARLVGRPEGQVECLMLRVLCTFLLRFISHVSLFLIKCCNYTRVASLQTYKGME